MLHMSKCIVKYYVFLSGQPGFAGFLDYCLEKTALLIKMKSCSINIFVIGMEERPSSYK